jgi:hypothetical protein
MLSNWKHNVSQSTSLEFVDPYLLTSNAPAIWYVALCQVAYIFKYVRDGVQYYGGVGFNHEMVRASTKFTCVCHAYTLGTSLHRLV